MKPAPYNKRTLQALAKAIVFASGAAALISVAIYEPSYGSTPGSNLGNATVDSSTEATVLRGAYLAKLGDCVACHSVPKGKPFAGGLPMTTPLGKIYTTNITPDPETGIGNWTEHDFEQALRRGVSKDGHNLYPAMPYPSYTKINDDDVASLYAYFMKGVVAVRQPNRPSDIPFPLNMRWPLAMWNIVFLSKPVYQMKPGEDAIWNRGAYLVQGLGHCGSCHTPRGVGFQEKASDESNSAWLSGALIDGWFASNLTGDARVGLGRWSTTDIATFLKTGANGHATAFGSMTDVINHSTQGMNSDDILAISTYLKSLPPVVHGTPTADNYDATATLESLAHPADNPGARVYTVYCMHCHAANGRGFAPYLAPIAGNPNVLEKNPISLINITLNGTGNLVIAGVPAPYPMPSYKNVLDDQQIADVITFIRAGWQNGAGAVTAKEVAKIRDMRN